tara:strand:+ start:224 stop:496 length:273 start_codon:yes stop_codon:yes gene_type:complete
MSNTLILGPEAAFPITVGTASSFSEATLVRATNTEATTVRTVTLLEADTRTGIGSISIPAGTSVNIEKKPADLLLASSANVKGTKVGFTN